MAAFKPKNIDEFSNITDTITVTGPGYSSIDYGAIPTITVSDLSLGNVSINPVWTTGTNYNWGANVVGAVGAGTTVDQGGKMSLRGDNADIDINGKSMKAWMEKVEQRLNLLTPNPELEKEWDELRKLGERYRKLEKKCKEKAEVWKKLKSMPPPNLG